MRFISNIEQKLEKAVRGTFSKRGSELDPVDIASRLRTELDDKAYSISSGRTLAPNVFRIYFANDDFPRVFDWGEPLASELCSVVVKHARDQGYTLRGSINVTFKFDSGIKQGEFSIQSSQESISGQQQSTASTPVQKPQISERITRPAAITPAESRPAPRIVLEINGQNYSVNSLPIVLGRGSQADLTLEDAGISRRHLEIVEQDGVYLAVDLGSTNGSFHNGEKLVGRHELTNGDVLTVGRARIVFRLMVPKVGR